MATLINNATGLKKRTRTALACKHGSKYPWPQRTPITTVEELAASTERELLSYCGLGLKGLRDIEAMLRSRGFTAKTSELLACQGGDTDA